MEEQLVPFGFYHLLGTIFCIGLDIGVTIAVGILLYYQVRCSAFNYDSVEQSNHKFVRNIHAWILFIYLSTEACHPNEMIFPGAMTFELFTIFWTLDKIFVSIHAYLLMSANLSYSKFGKSVFLNLQQTYTNAVPTTCQQDVLAMLVPSLLTSCQRLADNLLQGYRPATQQFVNKLWVTTLWQLDKITALLQLVDKLATSLLQTRLVDKLWDFYMCTLLFSSV